MKLKIKKLHGDAKATAYAHHDDAGFDLFASEDTVLKVGARTGVHTGIAIEIPEGFVGLIWDKSGIGIKEGIKTLGGVVDSTYRGEILIGMVNLSEKDYLFEKGHKVAQMLIQKKERVEIEEVSELIETKRGNDGFGSTGK